MTLKQQARLGVFHIEESILDRLFQADDNIYTPAVRIAQDLGIKSWDQENWVVSGILYKEVVKKEMYR